MHLCYQKAMKEDFGSASGAGSSSYYHGDEPPFLPFKIPEPMAALTSQLLTSDVVKAANFESIILFGGAIIDQRLNIQPKDYDLYVFSPKMVSDIKNIQARSGRASAYEEIEEYIGYDFPISVNEEAFQVGKSRLLEAEAVAIQGVFQCQKKRYIVDMLVSDVPKTTLQIAQLTSAPILSAAVSLYPGKREFAYHQDFELHASRRMLCLNTDAKDDRPDYFEKKAERKSLTLIKPPIPSGP